MPYQSATYPSPIGTLEIIASNGAITEIRFTENQTEHINNATGILKEACKQLEEYFQHKRKDFSLPLAPSGTDFQKKVWNILKEIPYGQVVSYKEISRRLGNEKQIRAAANANGRNPILIFIPCHRVIGSNGTLTGYSGGLDKKKKLLEIEQSPVQHTLF